MRLHVIGLPWTETTRTYLHCAYTEKVRKFCDMMSRGHEVFLYAGAENEAACTEHVPLISREERVGWFGEWDPNNLFERIDWDPASPAWAAMNERAIAAIRERCGPRDVLCLVTRVQDAVATALPHLTPVEWAVGYEGIRTQPYPGGTPACRVFESYAWMHHVYGRERIGDGFAYDAVIPNFFDPADFEYGRGGDYLVFLGRLVSRKGPQAAAEIAKRLGLRLLVAGPGAASHEPGRIVCREHVAGAPTIIEAPGVEYVGPVDVKQRAELLAGAACAIVPTLYVEPFGGVAVEAMLAGTPVVASDWGAFTETVVPGVSGYRFRTLAEGAQAVKDALKLRRRKVRSYAVGRYSLDAVYPMFDAHFRRIDQLWEAGWYT